MIFESIQIMYAIIPVEVKVIICAGIILNIYFYIKEKNK